MRQQRKLIRFSCKIGKARHHEYTEMFQEEVNNYSNINIGGEKQQNKLTTGFRKWKFDDFAKTLVSSTARTKDPLG